jgi:transposase
VLQALVLQALVLQALVLQALVLQALVRNRDATALDTWIQVAQASGLPQFQSFANGLVKDEAAVHAAPTTEWSNGLVEGHGHRLKLIKRQGYGRAKLDLLRRRAIAA